MESYKETSPELGNFKIGDIYKELKHLQSISNLHELKPLRVAVLRSYTAELIEPILKLKLIREGFNPVFFWGDYNQYAQEILDNSSPLYQFNPDIVLLLLRIEEVLPKFVWQFSEKKEDVWLEEIHSTAQHLVALVDRIFNESGAQVILQNFVLISPPYWGKFDTQRPKGQSYLLFELNRQLSEAFIERASAFVWDFSQVVMKFGYRNIYDPKNWFLSRNPFKHSGYINIADDLLQHIFSLLGKVKKCIVLDLDNTLWGGVIGEDGIEKIALGHDYPGNCYVEFQRNLLKLYNRGIILAINSKNNESEALEVIDNHPDMVLRREHFAAYQINWNDKASNMFTLAKELNIGLDSMIFVDDNPVECGWVRQKCPDCAVLKLPEKPYLIPSIVLDLPGVENIRLTEEDRQKGKMYYAQSERKQLEKSSASLGDFLTSLQMNIEISEADRFTIPRISQLTLKTNQLNMTTRRYSEADIAIFAEGSDTHVFAVSSVDRFGDNGIVGVLILRFEQAICRIDTFLLSCRVIGRTIEQSMIAFVAEFAKKRGAETLVGEFIPSERNFPARDIYKNSGFILDAENYFTADLKKQEFPYSPFIELSLPVFVV